MKKKKGLGPHFYFNEKWYKLFTSLICLEKAISTSVFHNSYSLLFPNTEATSQGFVISYAFLYLMLEKYFFAISLFQKYKIKG